ncbi:unnamed protein product [Amoebophrya sp. A120]|nr:unnamed protein product [Amoebophrya sp. A120]|eukprot:GSA120T00021053001.1
MPKSSSISVQAKNHNINQFALITGNQHALVRKYGINICRQCFRERATQIGFVKYQ